MTTAAEDIMTQALALIKQGCDLIATIDGGSPEEKQLRPAITLLLEAATIIKSVPDAGENPNLRWRLYQTIQAQEGGDNAALYKELRCPVHLGLVGECSDPVTLPCGHSFCKTCIAPFYLPSASVSNRKCPQCRTQITVSYDSLKPNVSLNGVTQHLLPRGTQRDTAAIAAIEAQINTLPTASSTYLNGGGAYGYYL